MKEYYIIIMSIGICTLFMVYLPVWCKFLKISYTIPLLFLGMLLFYLGVPLPWPDPIWPVEWTTKISEFMVIISLMSAGLKIGLKYRWKEWKKPLLLIGVTMPLSMIAVFLISFFILKFDIALSILLAAVLAPTDPVFASELQLEDKKDEKNTGLRYVLTAEAGLNDGLAFPFVFLAILISKVSGLEQLDTSHWLSFYVAFKIIGGALIGSIIGYVYSFTLQKFKKETQNKLLNGFVAISLTLTSYGIAELLDAYGFLAVFFTGLFARYHHHTTQKEEKGNEMILFVEETEKFFLVIWLLFFGGSIAAGILSLTTTSGIIFSFCLILLIRPIVGYIALIPTNFTPFKKVAISFFGVKGIGSVFYLSYAFQHGDFDNSNEIYGIVAYSIFISILVHGLTSQRVIDHFKKHNPG